MTQPLTCRECRHLGVDNRCDRLSAEFASSTSMDLTLRVRETTEPKTFYDDILWIEKPDAFGCIKAEAKL